MKVPYRRVSGGFCILILLTLLCGCGNKATTPTAAANGVDYNQYLNSPGYYACTDSAWYVCADNQIYFLDASLESPLRPLCAKADCNHNDPETCSSYLPSGAYNIYSWNDGLYYLRGSIEHGYTTDPVVLFSNEDEVAAATPPAEVSQPYVLCINQDWVFYSLTTGLEGKRSTALYGYQIATGETKLLIQEGFSLLGDLSQQGDTLYWYDTDGESYGALNRIDLSSGELSRVQEFSLAKSVWGTVDDRFLYLLGGEDADTAEVGVYDLEGNELQRLSCAELGTPLGYAFSSADKVFFHSSALGEHAPICWQDKDQLVNGKAAFHSIASDN